MTGQSSNIAEQLEWLRSTAPSVASSMRELAADPATRTVDRIETLIERLRRYGEIHADVAAGARKWLDGDPSGPHSLVRLDSAIQSLERAEAVASLLDRVLAIRPEFDTETPWRSEAERLRESCDSGTLDDDVAASLIAGKHAFAALVELVEQSPSSSNERWLQQFDRVRASYGDGVAAAAARGHFHFDQSDSP